ncbi:MAG: ribonuclease P protein component [Bacteroidales bacterium]|jgi:ribonuclease P protein component|nr:ribonuclease P protein component [Bacteroidales bacterium]MDD2823857.1 ribonuclease P protein component [Bacteroidales bacterium]MDD3100344.1 ribonuclease P protein component [Bacteroidales bacterium]MDD3639223.1 ribonuclease P protein component [Bacteroidales bacterium]MDD3943914.1 ribonuclease P protein component [Bacteroidales bacterium]
MKTEISYAFPKKMRLSSRKEIESLFSGADTFVAGPYRVFYKAFPLKETHACACSMTAAVPKKHIRSAVRRNLIKRRIRESFRLHFPVSLAPALSSRNIRLIFLCLYLPHEVRPFEPLEEKMRTLLERFSDMLEKGIDLSPDPVG